MDMDSWRDIGQDYIYHIKIGKKVYVGQSRASKPGSRLKYRLRAPFYFKKGKLEWSNNYDVPELAELIREKGLKQVEACFFSGPYYGVNPKLMEDFKKVFKKNDQGEDISNLNAAEILHILYFQHRGYHLFNKSMGGTGGSLTVISGNEIVKKAFTYTMSPKEAHSLFFTNIEVLSRLRRLTDYFNRIVLTDEWKNFYSQAIKKSGIKDNSHARATYSQLVESVKRDIIKNLWEYENLKKELHALVTKWAKNKRDVFFQYLQDYLEDEDIHISAKDLDMIEVRGKEIDGFVTYITNVIYNSLIKIGGTKNAQNLKANFNIINIGTLFSIKGITHAQQPWWTDFNSWIPENKIIIPEKWKKEIALYVFDRVYTSVADSSYYDNKDIVVHKFNDVYAFTHTPKHESLSAKIHKEYESMGLNFVGDQWMEFYSKMISLQINKRDPWKFTYEDYTGRDIAYRSQVQVETDYGMRYVGHVMTNMEYWGTTSIDEIEIY